MTLSTVSLRKASLLALSAPLVFALAACGGSSDAGSEELPAGEPIAHIAPPEGQAWQDIAAETPEGGFVIGNPDAPLKLVEYASHTCHVCADFSQDGAEAMNGYVNSGVVSYELRNLIRDPVDLTIAMIIRCGDPALFHPLADEAWANFDELMQTVQANSAAISQAAAANPDRRFQAIAQSSGVLDFFNARGVSSEQAMQCLADNARAEQLAERSDEQSEQLNITGTPTFFL
ncbi:MAG TPA: thioredoxin domain-containing protein, partial [Sphingomonadaceae bacterium]|nr:thioredoxin domain-containing protein [Sphingomonadaceae bacterium]